MDALINSFEIDNILSLKNKGDYVSALELITEILNKSPMHISTSSAWGQLINQPTIFNSIKEHESNVLFVTSVMSLLNKICDGINNDQAKIVSTAFLLGAQFRLTAHSDINLNNLMFERAKLFNRSNLVLINQEYSFKTSVSNKWRPRMAIYFRHLAADPETTSVLPFFYHAKSNGIEVILFVLSDTINSSFGKMLSNLSNRIICLSSDLSEAVQQIRKEDLDIFLFGNDITAKPSLGARLSFHRLARRSIITVSTLATVASEFVDEYFGSEYHNQRGKNKEFSESFISLPNPGFSFYMESDISNKLTIFIDKNKIGLPSNTIFLVSGANFTKLHNSLLDIWLDILKSLPEAVLFLYPFPPHFGPEQTIVIARITNHFINSGIDPKRIIILHQLPNKSSIISLLKQMDIGLDSFPYPGVTTMVDALIAGLPTITLESMTLRCSQGAAIVSSIGLNEVISSNHDDYCEKVVKLAKDSAYRDSLKVKINRAMANNPSFLNVDAFSKACVKEYFRIHEELKALG